MGRFKEPEHGIRAVCRLENNRVYVEWMLEPAEATRDADGMAACRRAAEAVLFRLTDRQGNLVLECIQDPGEDEPLVSVMNQAHLWDGMKDPYLYFAEAVLLKKGEASSGLSEGYGHRCAANYLPLRSISISGQEGGRLLLNGRLVILKAVDYAFPLSYSDAECQRKMLQDLQLLTEMGANCICVRDVFAEAACQGLEYRVRMLLHLCDRLGFFVGFPMETISKEIDLAQAGLMWIYGSEPKALIQHPADAPSFRGKADSLFLPGGAAPSSRYYQYKAKWSREPFVYLVPESLKRQNDGAYEISCYSNCSKVALYSDGRLFEVQQGGKDAESSEYFFKGIPAKGPGIALTAEGEGCSQSLAVHKTVVHRRSASVIYMEDH